MKYRFHINHKANMDMPGCVMQFVLGRRWERGRSDLGMRLRRYLESPLTEGVSNVVGYWG